MPEATAIQAPPVSTVVADDVLYEVIDGLVVEKPPMGAYQALLATTLIGLLYRSGATDLIGRPASELLFKLDRNLKRRPDVAFVSFERWPRGKVVPDGEAWEVVPDLAVEVVSPSNTANEVLTKLDEYFQAGVRLVWVIYPLHRKLYVYTSTTDVRILQPGDDLDGGPVLPGFRVPVKAVFGDED